MENLTFNRTILELKFRSCEHKNTVEISFNRTILELKFDIANGERLPKSLLIEPYWN